MLQYNQYFFIIIFFLQFHGYCKSLHCFSVFPGDDNKLNQLSVSHLATQGICSSETSELLSSKTYCVLAISYSF